jgi:small multidrug resistance pump
VKWIALIVAIACEVSATLALRPAVTGRPRFYVVVAIGYATAFAGLTVTLAEGMDLAVSYGMWPPVASLRRLCSRG